MDMDDNHDHNLNSFDFEKSKEISKQFSQKSDNLFLEFKRIDEKNRKDDVFEKEAERAIKLKYLYIIYIFCFLL